MTKPFCFHVLAFSTWTLIKIRNSHLPGSKPGKDYKYLHARQIPHQLSFPPKTYLTE